MQRVVVDSSIQSSWPADATSDRIASAVSAGRPLITAIFARLCIGSRPTSAPYKIAAAIASGLPRSACGTKSVSAM
jgi:hypothetical protein